MKNIFYLLFCMVCIITIIIISCEKQTIDGGAPLFQTTTINGVAKDAVSFDNLTDAVVKLEESGSKNSSPLYETTVDDNGEYSFAGILSGTYDITITKDGYHQMSAKQIQAGQEDVYVAFLPVTTDITTKVGGISGIVLNNEGEAVPNASIAISAQDESITNGYFISTTTNQHGQFFIGAIPLESTNEFKIRCVAANYQTKVINHVFIEENEMVVVNFNIEPTDYTYETIFYEGFEDANDWDMTGFWHIHEQNSAIYNQAYLENYVKLAPNDTTEGRIPAVYEGNRMAWYGEPETGNFMGEQYENDYEFSGGTSEEPNRGKLISPPIDLTNVDQASVNFWSWFEIESVNPNEFGFDLMEIYAINESSDTILLGKLNPYTDPVLENRAALPFTSGGFNQAPIWKYEEFDLSTFAGSYINLKFVFDTRDHLYNGFRGWFIDELRVIEKGLDEDDLPDDAPDRNYINRDK